MELGRYCTVTLRVDRHTGDAVVLDAPPGLRVTLAPPPTAVPSADDGYCGRCYAAFPSVGSRYCTACGAARTAEVVAAAAADAALAQHHAAEVAAAQAEAAALAAQVAGLERQLAAARSREEEAGRDYARLERLMMMETAAVSGGAAEFAAKQRDVEVRRLQAEVESLRSELDTERLASAKRAVTATRGGAGPVDAAVARRWSALVSECVATLRCADPFTITV